MDRYLIVFRGAPGGTPGAADREPGSWNTWFDALGANLVDRGAWAAAAVEVPSRLLGPKESTSSLHGYAVIAARDFDAAVELAERCPIFDEGGSVEIARLGAPAA
jgi:hypothetical protein